MLKLLPLELAAQHGVAIAIQSVDEVLAGDADLPTLPVLQLAVVDVAPFLHRQYASSTKLLTQAGRRAQPSPFRGWHRRFL